MSRRSDVEPGSAGRKQHMRMTQKRRSSAVVFAHKNYSRRFIKLRLNQPFWTLKVLIILLSMYGRVIYLSDFIKSILICVPKMNEGLTGVERHEGE